MSAYIIEGGHPLDGSVRIHGAKNSVLPILAACLLAPGECVIHNCPELSDVAASLDILRHLGCRAERQGDAVVVDASAPTGWDVPDALMREMRSSVIFLGAILGRMGRAELCAPGGCELGPRPIDLHLGAIRGLGGRITEDGGGLRAEGALRGADLVLSLPSVGATENAMLAAVCAAGTTTITNAAREPEIVDLQNFLRCLGARVEGAGTGRIAIQGGCPLHPGEYRVMADRIVSATYLCAVACAGGEGELLGTDGAHLGPVLAALTAAGCEIGSAPDRLQIRRTGALRGFGALRTGPYPAFPTDAQPLLGAVAAGAWGQSRITETIFDRRFRYLEGLTAMGAAVQTEGDTACFSGRTLHGAQVEATDLRGGAALTLAALGARGESRIYGLPHIDRGYQGLEGSLAALGGRIRRETRQEAGC